MTFLKVAALGLQIASFVAAQTAPIDGTQYGNNWVPNRPDNELVDANFPDVDVQLLSPAFLNPTSVPIGFSNATSPPTRLRDIDYFLSGIALQHPDWANYNTFPFQSEEGRPFPYLFLSSTPDSATNGSAAENSEKLKVWIQASQHGNEPASEQAAMAWLGKMSNDTEYAQSVLDVMDVMVLPVYNPDGMEYFQRILATNFDPNRDHVKLVRQHTRNLKPIFSNFNAHIVMDMHEYGSASQYGPEENLQPASDSLFSAAKNLNIHPDIRALSEDLFAENMGNDLSEAGFRWQPYATAGSSSNDTEIVFNEAGSDARIGRNAMGLTQSVTFLFETRGIGLGAQQFQRRTACGLAMIESIINTAIASRDDVYNTITSSIDDFIASDAEIIVTDYTEPSQRTWELINQDTGEIVDQEVTWFGSTPTTANVTRPRPAAYLIPRAWTEVVERMRVFGLEVSELEYGWTGQVETFDIVDNTLASSYFEGIALNNVEYETVERQVSLPPGSYWMDARQKNIALAFQALEIGNIDSYAAFGIVPVTGGDQWPIYRVMP